MQWEVGGNGQERNVKDSSERQGTADRHLSARGNESLCSHRKKERCSTCCRTFFVHQLLGERGGARQGVIGRVGARRDWTGRVEVGTATKGSRPLIAACLTQTASRRESKVLDENFFFLKRRSRTRLMNIPKKESSTEVDEEVRGSGVASFLSFQPKR